VTVVAIGFILALPFTGLQPLWTAMTIPSMYLPHKTSHATGTLLLAIGLLILLINSHYQDGRPETRNSRVLTAARVPAALVLMPLVALAIVGLYLRVAQYGWTPTRIVGAGLALVAFCHALGYAIAALRSGAHLRYLPVTNTASALVAVVVLFSLLTPIADPRRLAVASQVARLESGAVEPERFDFKFLATPTLSGEYGKDALERLKRPPEGPNAGRIIVWARRALTLPAQDGTLDWKAQPATAESRTANIKMLPPSTTLPADFLAEDWATSYGRVALPPCLTLAKRDKCEAVVFNLAGAPGSGIILLASSSAWAFGRDAQGKWTAIGMLQNTLCPGVREALRAGKVVSANPAFRDIEVNGVRLPASVAMRSCPPSSR
jgi:hypothetical protein